MKGIIEFSPGKRTSKVILWYLVFSAYVAWIGKADLAAASAFVVAVGGGILGAKVGNAMEAKHEKPNGNGGAGG